MQGYATDTTGALMLSRFPGWANSRNANFVVNETAGSLDAPVLTEGGTGVPNLNQITGSSPIIAATVGSARNMSLDTATLEGTLTTDGFMKTGTAAGGDLSGTYVNPTVSKVHGVAYPASPSSNTVPVVTGSNTVTYEAVPNAALANSSVTVNGTGISLGGSGTITAAPSGSAGGDLTGTYPSPTVAAGAIDNSKVAVGAALDPAKFAAGTWGLPTPLTMDGALKVTTGNYIDLGNPTGGNISWRAANSVNAAYGLFSDDVHALDTVYGSQGMVVGPGRENHSHDGALWIESVGSSGAPTPGYQESKIITTNQGLKFFNHSGAGQGSVSAAYFFDDDILSTENIECTGTMTAQTGFLGNGGMLEGIGENVTGVTHSDGTYQSDYVLGHDTDPGTDNIILSFGNESDPTIAHPVLGWNWSAQTFSLNYGLESGGFIGDGSQLTGLSLSNVTGVLAASKGGTGQSSFTTGDILYASGSSAISKLADVATGNVLLSGGTSTAPSYGQITNSHVASGAAIADTKLATISTAGKVSDSALSSNVALKNAANTFSATSNTFSGALNVGTGSGSSAGVIYLSNNANLSANTSSLFYDAPGGGNHVFTAVANGSVFGNLEGVGTDKNAVLTLTPTGTGICRLIFVMPNASTGNTASADSMRFDTASSSQLELFSSSTADKSLRLFNGGTGVTNFAVDGRSGFGSAAPPSSGAYVQTPSLNINGGTDITGHLHATAAVDFASMAAGGTDSKTLTVTGAATGDTVYLGAPANTDTAGMMWSAYVSASNTITIRVLNESGGVLDPASATWAADVWKH